MVDTKITALYCRVACKDDDAILSQEHLLRDYALKQGFENICVYADNGCNGLDFNRPAFSRLMCDIQAGLVSRVIIKNISRITRNYPDLIQWMGGIREKGVSFISLAEGITVEHVAGGFAKGLQTILMGATLVN